MRWGKKKICLCFEEKCKNWCARNGSSSRPAYSQRALIARDIAHLCIEASLILLFFLQFAFFLFSFFQLFFLFISFYLMNFFFKIDDFFSKFHDFFANCWTFLKKIVNFWMNFFSKLTNLKKINELFFDCWCINAFPPFSHQLSFG